MLTPMPCSTVPVFGSVLATLLKPLHGAGGPPLPPGISGIAALNSSLGGGVNPNLVNPNVAPVVDPSTVPFQEGWVKIRGIPPGVGKKELCVFFGVSCLS